MCLSLPETAACFGLERRTAFLTCERCCGGRTKRWDRVRRFVGVAAVLVAAIIVFMFSSCISFGQSAPVFAVASVKASQHPVGRDTVNRVVFRAAGITGKNVTFERLIVDAYGVQPY